MHHLPAQMTSTETLHLTHPRNPQAICFQALSSVSHHHFICHLLLLYCLLSFDFVKEAFFVLRSETFIQICKCRQECLATALQTHGFVVLNMHTTYVL